MSAEWKKLKSEVSEYVDKLKTKLEPEFNADPKKSSIIVLVKVKDNAKEAIITVAQKATPDDKFELAINLQNSKNLAKQFETLFSDFKSK